MPCLPMIRPVTPRLIESVRQPRGFVFNLQVFPYTSIVNGCNVFFSRYVLRFFRLKP
jgi:hypothetical protein